MCRRPSSHGRAAAPPATPRRVLPLLLIAIAFCPEWSSCYRNWAAEAFVVVRPPPSPHLQRQRWRRNGRDVAFRSRSGGSILLSTASASASSSEASSGKESPDADAVEALDPSEMRLSEMKTELKERGVSFADCFDRESLTKRLIEARDGTAPGAASVAAREADGAAMVDEPAPAAASAAVEVEVEAETETTGGAETPSPPPASAPAPSPDSSSSSTSSSSSSFDRESVLAELRSLRVKELRSRLSSRGIRWANMIEKDDLVRALADSMEAGANFSPSGALRPGEVADIDDEVLSVELGGGASTPLLLDVYATWCGPCQMMAPQLKEAAAELGDTVRVAKIDSDKYQAWASRLNVGGLPTVIVFDGEGKEVQRVEGALMKQGLVEMARNHA